MPSLSRQRLGVALVLVAVVAVVGSLAVSAATGPSTASNADTNDSADRGKTVVGMQAAGRVSMFDSNGSRLWTFGTPDTDYFDVTVLDNGSVLTGYITEGEQECGQYEAPCARTGFQIIDPGPDANPDPQVTSEWSFPVPEMLNNEVHDVEPLPSGEFVMTDMANERIFTVAPNGTTTWQWNASERYDAPDDPVSTDWLHINDVDRIGEGRFLVSVRNANQLLIVQRGEGVVDVINEDTGDTDDAICKENNGLRDFSNDSNGDVLCGDSEVMNHQHNPQYLGPDAILVADSDNNRIVELHNESGNWEVAWGVDSSNDVAYSWPRDADRLPNGNTLVTDSRRDRVVEVAPNGTTVWSTDTGTWPYEAERLPYQEMANDSDLPRMNASGDAPVVDGGSSIPYVDEAYAGLSYVVSLPVWFAAWHIAVIVVGLLLAIVGLGLVWSGRRAA
ncbi:arylsulfotransferase family protein [Halococcus salsus]|uniref:arylsulfotransferase family protein n=1 Tax=Halococcus salsus TaxID=2162894 RepID=UPI001359711F|nr:arylsulfotransferase family protein [Halococcus salsus]